MRFIARLSDWDRRSIFRVDFDMIHAAKTAGHMRDFYANAAPNNRFGNCVLGFHDCPLYTHL